MLTIFLSISLGVPLLPAASAAPPWPMAGHDARRTGQSEATGPGTIEQVDSVALPEEAVVNMPVTLDDAGNLTLGTWGVVRSFGSDDPRDWDKADGHVFSFGPDLAPRWEYAPPRVPYCYDYAGHPGDDVCPDSASLDYFNGTVEGTPAVRDGVVYVGRGDGVVSALDAETGELLWSFSTFNPAAPGDPEGGGEVVGGPLLDGEGNVYFGTVAVGPWETNAVYSLTPDGVLRWRSPADTAGYDTSFLGALALSPDGETVYAPGAYGPRYDALDTTLPGAVYAFARDGTLKWTFNPVNEAAWWLPTVWVWQLAVGADGTVYAGGGEPVVGGTGAMLFALKDLGTEAAYAWPAMVEVDADHADMVGGLALHEVEGETVRVYASSGDRYAALGGYADAGVVVAVDPADGAVVWTFDPTTTAWGGAFTGIAVDAGGRVYTGLSGSGASAGAALALDTDGALSWAEPLEGQLEWSHPVLGADGTVYLADSHRCPLSSLPIEDGACGGSDITPRVYALSGTAAAPPDKATPAACGCASSGASGVEVGMLAVLFLRRRRREV